MSVQLPFKLKHMAVVEYLFEVSFTTYRTARRVFGLEINACLYGFGRLHGAVVVPE
jgi:hypothetical protein